MSFLGIGSAKRSPKQVKNYLEGQDQERVGPKMKTVSADIGDSERWDEEMDDIRRSWGKDGPNNRKYYHFVLATEKQDNPNYTPDKLHQMQVEFAEKISRGGEFAFAVITHTPETDKEFKRRRHEKVNQNIHGHIIVNAVGTHTGRRYHLSKKDIKQLKQLAEDLSHKYGLKSFLDITESKADWRTAMKGKLETIFSRDDIATREELDKALGEAGIKIKRIAGKDAVTYQDLRDKNRKVRSRILGGYDADAISMLLEKGQKQRALQTAKTPIRPGTENDIPARKPEPTMKSTEIKPHIVRSRSIGSRRR